MALTNDQITAQNFKDFYGQIRPYLNGSFPTPIVNCFAKSDMHSTDEKIIGQWEDGKPLYQRTYNFTLPVIYDGTENGCDVVTLENTKIISVDGYISGNNQTSYPLTFTTVSSGETRFVNCFKNGSGIVKIKTNLGTISEKSGYVTLRYVKTTDSAIKVGTGTDYSTDEQIIGSWIDGKPLYQKTIDCGALPNASQKIVSTGIQNAETLVWAFGCTTNDNNTTKMILPRIRKDNKDILIGYEANLLSITIDTESDRSSVNAYVVLQYTKTTD